jgi:hypothetical protein
MNPLFILTFIMVIAGIAGGYANYLLAKSDEASTHPTTGESNAKSLGAWDYIVIGVVAVFIVPLFLSLVQSGLLSQAISAEGLNSEKVFIFAGFCLIAAISSRAFIQTISTRVLALAHQASRSAAEAKEQQQTLTTEVDEIAAVLGSQSGESEPILELDRTPETEGAKVSLSNDERRVLEALRAKPYSRRTLTGVAADGGLEKGKAKVLLGGLEVRGLAREVESKKSNNLLYQLTSLGAYALGVKEP